MRRGRELEETRCENGGYRSQSAEVERDSAGRRALFNCQRIREAVQADSGVRPARTAGAATECGSVRQLSMLRGSGYNTIEI